MSDFVSILNQTREAFASVARLEAASARAPADAALQINLAAKMKFAERVQSEFLEGARTDQIDVCRYRIIPGSDADYKVYGVSRSLMAFQEVVTSLFDAIQNGPKKNAKFSTEIRSLTGMSIAYTYPGSLGVILTLPSERTLFEGKFDEVVGTFQAIFSIRDQQDIQNLARDRGRSVVRSIYQWAESNDNASFSVDVGWRRSDGIFQGGLVDKGEFQRMMEIIDKAEEIERDEVEIYGVLVGADLALSTFHMIEPDGIDYKGRFYSDFVVPENFILDRRYHATIVRDTVRKYATDEEKITYRLKAIGP